MWRLMLIAIVLLSATGVGAAFAQEPGDRPHDLAAMLVPPSAMPESGFQFARGGYLSHDDARYLIEERYSTSEESIKTALDGASWRQGYTGTHVLLSDRSIRSSDLLASITTTIHELRSDDGAILLEALLAGSPPDGAEDRDAAVEGATTRRVVTSQDDTLVTLVRTGRFLVEVVSADRKSTPHAEWHSAVVGQTLERAERLERITGEALSHRLVLVDDERLIPVAVPTEEALVHTWYRVLDGEVVPAAGELDTPAPSDLPPGLEEMVVARQTAELSSQNWVTTGVIVARFDKVVDASAVDGAFRDPLDEFAVSEVVSPVESSAPGIQVEAISGEAREGGRYSGFRIITVEDSTISQLTIRAMGTTLIDRAAAERWAMGQAACAAGGACEDVALTALLATSGPATPQAGTGQSGEYASPVAPWSVSYDTGLWHERDRFAEGGYDYLYLRSERMDITFETIVNHHGDPEQCVLDELDLLRANEDRAAITVGSDDASEQPGGLTGGHAWIVYTVEPLDESRAGEEYTIRIDCYTVVEGSTSLVVQTRAPREAWIEVAPLGESLRAQIRMDGVPISGMTGGPHWYDPTSRSDEMIDRRPWVGIAA